jgi:hypothetical protein
MRSAILTAVITILLPAARASAQEAQVFVLGALGALHGERAGFTFQTLDTIIRRIAPDVVLLEVTPEELAGRLETRGRPEYPAVVWPLLQEPGAPVAYAMEAGQPLYGELTGAGGRLFTAFAAERPADNAALDAHTSATTALLLAHWDSPPDTQDEATDAAARARHALRAALLPASDEIQVRWDSVLVDVATKAIAAHPGKRVLILASFRNRFMFLEALREAPSVRLVNMHEWLTNNGFGRDAAATRR